MSDVFNPALRGRVIKEWKVTYPDPIDVQAGEDVKLGVTDPEWPGWQWCTGVRGRSGWVPIAFFILVDKETGRMRCNYSAQELAVSIDEKINLHQQESGWYWASNTAGKKGWIPAKNVELQQDDQQTKK
jgi:uncharacterized protein YgiM (DUF1202 family)